MRGRALGPGMRNHQVERLNIKERMSAKENEKEQKTNEISEWNYVISKRQGRRVFRDAGSFASVFQKMEKTDLW